ncbi:hypothetical protein NHJ13051_004916 [Beauveria bassiana]
MFLICQIRHHAGYCAPLLASRGIEGRGNKAQLAITSVTEVAQHVMLKLLEHCVQVDRVTVGVLPDKSSRARIRFMTPSETAA